MSRKIKTSLSLDEELCEKIDQQAAAECRSRSSLITKVLVDYLMSHSAEGKEVEKDANKTKAVYDKFSA